MESEVILRMSCKFYLIEGEAESLKLGPPEEEGCSSSGARVFTCSFVQMASNGQRDLGPIQQNSRAIAAVKARILVLLGQAKEFSGASEKQIETWWPFAAAAKEHNVSIPEPQQRRSVSS